MSVENHICVSHHLGLGDNITCHGIVRYYAEKYSKITSFAKHTNYENVKYMYNDLDNLELVSVYDDNEVNNYIASHEFSKILRVGFDELCANWGCENFVKQFYDLASVPMQYEYEKFYINRDMNKEMELFNSLNIKEQEYTFVHDGSILQSSKADLVDQSIPSIIPDHAPIFHWIYTILNAKEIHCIDSSFICLVDLLDTKDIPIFNHRHIKRYPDFIAVNPKPHKDWQYINAD
jgi:hypothetical protein|tara:strand:- start:8346 stop:9047 length:702 start_codon:yes stop_codon:yes gene_type:complete